ncbi:MAG: ketoacyl-ACP synthase III [Bacteroidetes bacterium]|nr:ketoacyl-ACP synthase III [Bacteroidota bacterium]MBU1720071.1 ketoacyl-ACP synthase III [Bacteroidota bacterium]
MNKIRAAITGIEASVPEYILTNQELEKMVDTTDEWIMSRTGVKERHILKGEGMGMSVMGAEAVTKLLEKTNTRPDEIELLICGTVTADMKFPAAANLICHKTGIVGALSFDINAACSGFIFALETAARFIETGKYKKAIVVGGDKMSSMMDYTDRQTCVIFGDGAGAVMLEPRTDGTGLIDSVLRTDGSGHEFLYMKAGGSAYPATFETVERREHFVHQEGQAVFKHAVKNMADVSVEIMQRNDIAPNQLAWLVPHQANMRIIEATAHRMGIRKEQVMINIEKYGNTTSGTIPLCLFDYEKQLRKGDNIILSAFGGGFTWGAIYLKWAYDPK